MDNEKINLLKNSLNYSLSGRDLYNFIDGKADIKLYSELKDYYDIMDLFGKKKAVVIIYLTKKNYGHWVCLLNHKDNIEFFDSYGKEPDTQLKNIDKKFKIESGQDKKYLTKLLMNANKKIIYNTEPLQKNLKNNIVATCGRHVGCRIHFKDINLNDYVKY